MSTSDEQESICDRLPMKFYPEGIITHLRACNSELLMVISDRTVVHISLQNKEYRRIEIQLPDLASSEDRVAHLHLDSGGIHALVSTVAGENIYVNVPGHTSNGLKRLKGQVISAVGWNIENIYRNETGFIVLGTMTGCLLEAELTSSGHLSYMKELMPAVPAFNEKQPIDCIQLYQCSDSAQWILMFTTASRLYILKGPAIPAVPASTSSALLSGTGDPLNAALCSLFNDEALNRYYTLADDRDGDKNQPSQLAVYPQSVDESPQKFAWLASGGIRMGSMKSIELDGHDALDIEATLPHKRVDGRLDYPLDLALTEYHAVLLYSDRLVAIPVLNQGKTYEDRLGKKFGVTTGMTRDPISGTIWVYTSTGVVRYRPIVKEIVIPWKEMYNCQKKIDSIYANAAKESLKFFAPITTDEEVKLLQTRNHLLEQHLAERSALIGGIPGFWAAVLGYHPDIGGILTEDDVAVLKRLRYLEVTDFADIRSGYRIQLHFGKNRFFTNDLLRKDFFLKNGEPNGSESTIINWRKAGETPRLEFFEWFTDNSNSAHDFGAEIKDDVWRNAIWLFETAQDLDGHPTPDVDWNVEMSTAEEGDGDGGASKENAPIEKRKELIDGDEEKAEVEIQFKLAYKRQTFDITAPANQPVTVFADTVQTLTNVPPALQKLICRGSKLLTGQTLADAKVTSGAEVLLIGSTATQVQEASTKPTMSVLAGLRD